jgi:hypothetical protein
LFLPTSRPLSTVPLTARVMLNTYAGLWPNDDELARGALTELYMERPEGDVSVGGKEYRHRTA